MGTALVASPMPSGHLTTSMLLILLPCSLTLPRKSHIRTLKMRSMQFGVAGPLDLYLLNKIKCMSYVHKINHSTVIIAAHHAQIILDIRFLGNTGITS
jgi:hypothetical protein